MELAEINGVPPTTVHRWIKEARRRGLLGPGRRLVYYDPDSPEVQQWAVRARSGEVSGWDLAHDPVLRAWASRIRKGVISPTEALYDPIMEAGRARMGDESTVSYTHLPMAGLLLGADRAAVRGPAGRRAVGREEMCIRDSAWSTTTPTHPRCSSGQ